MQLAPLHAKKQALNAEQSISRKNIEKVRSRMINQQAGGAPSISWKPKPSRSILGRINKLLADSMPDARLQKL